VNGSWTVDLAENNEQFEGKKEVKKKTNQLPSQATLAS